MNTWYTTTKKDDLQGLVCDEKTGENIAVTYKAENAALVAAAPELLEALEMALYSSKGDWRGFAYYVIEKAKGE